MRFTDNTFPEGFLAGKRGLRVIGDVHGDPMFGYAIDEARAANLAILSLGDLTDASEDHAGLTDAAEAVRHMVTAYEAGDGILIPGNHCYKLWRYFRALRRGDGSEAKISTSHGLSRSIEEIQTSADADDLVTRMIEMIDASRIWHRAGKMLFAHAGGSMKMFDLDPPTMAAATKKDGLFHRAIYGQTDGTKSEDGFPTRRYDWVDRMEAGTTTIIGHDKRKQVTTVEGAEGGKMIHLDTGAGKGGHLSWMDIPAEELL